MKQRRHQKGLSMAELMFAMTVMFVVCSFVMSMFITGLRQTAQASRNQDLESLTRQKVGEFRVIEFDQLDSQTMSGSFPAPHQSYRFEVAYRALPGEEMSDARVVEVTVSHPEYGRRNARTVRANVQKNPGQAAWEKFDCGACHSMPAAGYPAGTGLVSLAPIDVDNPSNPRPIGPGGITAYIEQSIRDTNSFIAYDDMGTMTDFYVEGEPEFDPDSSDEFVAANSMSNEELQALAAWIADFQEP